MQYDGSSFAGFQRQQEVRTIQAELEDALSSIAAEPIVIAAAGRTDRGVHATQQVITFGTSAQRSERAWLMGTNSLLPNAIAIVWVREVPASFHARFSALWRRYLYIYGLRSDHQVFLRDYVTWINEPLDIAQMRCAAQHLLGEHDFSSLQAAKCGSRTAWRYIYHLNVQSVGRCVVIDVAANAFLLHMVRNLAAVLRAVGSGKMNAKDVLSLLVNRNRALAPPTAQAKGLYLTAVGFAEELDLPVSVRIPAALGLGMGTERFCAVQLPPDYYRRAVRT